MGTRLDCSRSGIQYTEIFVIEIFSYTLLCTKINCAMLTRMCIIHVDIHGKGSLVRKFAMRNTFKYKNSTIYGIYQVSMQF